MWYEDRRLGGLFDNIIGAVKSVRAATGAGPITIKSTKAETTRARKAVGAPAITAKAVVKQAAPAKKPVAAPVAMRPAAAAPAAPAPAAPPALFAPPTATTAAEEVEEGAEAGVAPSRGGFFGGKTLLVAGGVAVAAFLGWRFLRKKS